MAADYHNPVAKVRSIHRIHHVAWRTHDLERLRAFYERGLELPLVRDASPRSVWLDLDGVVLMLECANEHEPAPQAADMQVVVFAIEERHHAQMVERLLELGAHPDGATTWTSYFRDPDGRRIGVSHYRIERT